MAQGNYLTRHYSARAHQPLLNGVRLAFTFALEGSMNAKWMSTILIFTGLLAGSTAYAQAPAPVPAPAPAPAAEPAPPPSVVKIGNENKRTVGTVVDTDTGDLACYLTLKDGKGSEFIEAGKAEFCTQKPPLKGKEVRLTYKLETLPASSCNGDPKCTKTETIPFVIEVKVLN